MSLTPPRPAPHGLVALALLAGLLPPSLLAWRLLHFPGWDLTDEAVNLAFWQHAREGLGSSWLVAHGCVHRGAVELFLRLGGGGLMAARIASLTFYGLGLLALLGLGRRLLGPAAAWGAWVVGGAAALPAVQLGSLLSPQWQPLLWAGLAWAALALRRPWQALLWGALCGLLLLDYEGWALGLPGLAALLLLPQPEPRLKASRRAAWAALGLALGGGWALWHSAPLAADYLVQRHAYSAPGSGRAWGELGSHLLQFFWGGGQALPTQGVPLGAPQFPLWALAPLLLALPWGLRSTQQRGATLALLLGALAPLLAFALYAPGVPSQRVLTAWPALCLLAGLGLAQAWQWRPAAAWALALWVIAGGLLEARAYVAGVDALGPRFYGNSGAWMKAARTLSQGPAPELCWDLDAMDRGDLAFTYPGPLAPSGQGALVAVIPWQCRPALAGRGGALWALETGEGQPPVLLYRAQDAEAAELREAHRTLKAFWDAHVDGPDEADLIAATQAPIANRWVRDSLWEARFRMARKHGHPEAAEGERALSLGLLRVDPLLRQARDQFRTAPIEAERLLRIALDRDPSRREGWRELGQLLAAQGRQKDLEILNKRIDALTTATYEPVWLME